jgi:hypothetical protein
MAESLRLDRLSGWPLPSGVWRKQYKIKYVKLPLIQNCEVAIGDLYRGL